MAVYVLGLVGILVFYIIVLAVGIWAGTKQKNSGQEEVLLAGRNLGLFVGVLTLIATWVGGGYINGSAEKMFTSGLAWCQVPIGYSLSLLVGILFTKPMRDARYVTMLDPFQDKYGSRVGGLLFIPALCGDIFWCGAILNALGSSLVVILELDSTVSVVISAIFAGAYTVAGGFYSVTYTDVIQLLCIVFGLVVSAPFAYGHSAVSSEKLREVDWVGTLDKDDVGVWLDDMLLLIFGGIPWQGYFQRILSMRSTGVAKALSVGAFFGCLLMSIPPAIIGVIARGTDWENVEGYNRNVTSHEASIILPLALRYLTPGWVSFFGLGAVSAAVMSSADSSILASSAMFSRNVYKLAIRPKASEKEVLWVLRFAVVVVTGLATLMALTIGSVYYLSYLSSDLVYVILFPQLFLVIYWSKGVNTYGCLSSYIVGFVLRILAGEKGIGIPPTIHFPFYDHVTQTQKFPVRTLIMLCAMLTHVLVSTAARYLFESGMADPSRHDFLGAFSHLINGDPKNAGKGSKKKKKGDGTEEDKVDFYHLGDPSSVPSSIASGGATNAALEIPDKFAENGAAVRCDENDHTPNGVVKFVGRSDSFHRTRVNGDVQTAQFANGGIAVPQCDEHSKF